MRKVNIDALRDFSKAVLSFKRLVIIIMLKGRALSYSQIKERFDRLGMSISSSEMYKHLSVLMDTGVVVKQGKLYMLTKRGDELYLFSSFMDDSFTHGSVVLWLPLCTLTGLPQTCSPSPEEALYSEHELPDAQEQPVSQVL